MIFTGAAVRVTSPESAIGITASPQGTAANVSNSNELVLLQRLVLWTDVLPSSLKLLYLHVHGPVFFPRKMLGPIIFENVLRLMIFCV